MRRTTTLVRVAVLAAALVVIGAGPADPAAADPVQRASREVAQVQAAVDRTATRLSAGTRELERSRARLAAVRERRDAAAREADHARRQAAAARDRLRRVAAAASRSPVPDAFVLALSGPEQFSAAVRVQADVRRVRDGSGDSATLAGLARAAAQPLRR